MLQAKSSISGWRDLRPLLALTLLVALAACTRGDRGVVGRSDLGQVTRAELDAYIVAQPERLRRPKAAQSPREHRQAMLENLMLGEAFASEGATLVDRPGVAGRLQEARFKVLLDAYDQEVVAPRIQVGDETLRRYYDEHPDEFGNPEQIRLRNIFRRVAVDASPAERAAVKTEMEALLDKLRQGASFGELARTTSDSETAPLDGLIGRLSRGALDPSVEAIVWKLKEGEISDVVETPVGFQVFKLDNHIPPQKLDFDEARGRLRRRMERQARERLLDETFTRLLAESGAVYRPELLAAAGPGQTDGVLFSLGEHVIRVADVEQYRASSSFMTVREKPPQQWLREAALNRLMVWSAVGQGLDQRPEVKKRLDAAERDVRIGLATESRLRAKTAELERSGALEEYYDKNYRRFQTPKLHHLRVITTDFSRFAKADDGFQFLATLGDEIRAGRRDMAAAAKELSTDVSAPYGGDLGWLVLDGFGGWAGPRAQRRVSEMREGELSEPILLERYDRAQLRYNRSGFMLVRVEGITYPEVLPFERAREQVNARYLQEHRPELEQEIKREVLAAIHATVVEENL